MARRGNITPISGQPGYLGDSEADAILRQTNNQSSVETTGLFRLQRYIGPLKQLSKACLSRKPSDASKLMGITSCLDAVSAESKCSSGSSRIQYSPS
jgi:hypothetical protein